ncbi:hypothetical protein MELA_02015 [Candidatus Methylomirabilis lanthanidiphila]|uniref:Uncharacterized protein n=1 Tax=Candidatus Methylomirabilis lanthanidiphila TaxID=2211376 RepID=A0A564ZJV9_9BACT|nr:hypothetical protein [Candidatus Methylomirabilis lanthanidiphila]VUZ85630.1 hypothetical protein MELA_02015 [Candidatus Methylomirabilis lanthanidiphila]
MAGRIIGAVAVLVFVGIVLIAWLENEKRRFETAMLDAVYKVEQGIREGHVADVDLLKETEKAFQDAARALKRGESVDKGAMWRLRDSVLRALDAAGNSETAMEIQQAVRDDLAKANAELDKVKQTSSP